MCRHAWCPPLPRPACHGWVCVQVVTEQAPSPAIAVCVCVRRWVQAECRGLSDVDAPEVNPLLQRAAAALRERQVCAVPPGLQHM